MSAWDEMSAARALTVRDGIDLSTTRTLEIGPLSHPMVRRADGSVTYVDHTDAATLRANFGASPHVNAGDIVEVDAIWGERTLLECLRGERVDNVIASHVAEHVPDLVTWLAEIREVLRPGGQLRLVLPDSRYSADALRERTRVSDLLAAWLIRARRPQPRDVLDFSLHASGEIDGWGLFGGTATLDGKTPNMPFAAAVALASRVRDDPALYQDVHCLVADARTFARLMERLGELGLLRLSCVRLIDASMPLLEFYAFMTPCDDAAEVARSWRAASGALDDAPAGSAAAARAIAARAREAELLEAEAELARLRRSLSWRLTAPLRTIRSRF